MVATLIVLPWVAPEGSGVGTYFTAEERILVQLLGQVRYEDDYEVPIDVTQYGIGRAIGSGQDYVSRALKRMRTKDLVNEKQARVRGLRERRKVYFLTREGIEKAQQVEQAMRTIVVTVIQQDGTSVESPALDVGKLVGETLRLVEVARDIDDKRVFDWRALASRRVEEVPDLGEAAPIVERFVGRRRELERMHKWAKTHPIIAVYGIAGIGKTALVARFVEELKTSVPVVWVRFHEWDTPRSVLTPISKALAREGHRKLRTYLEGTPSIDLADVAPLLVEELPAVQLLLVFDDLHKVGSAVLQVLMLLVELLPRGAGVQLIAISRHPMLFYDRREVIVKNAVAELRLVGLDREGTEELLRSRNLPPELGEQAYLFTEGHPLALELVQREGIEQGRDLNIHRYIEEEIFSRLTPQEKRLLEVASVYRYPVHSRALFIDPSLSYETLAGLVNRALLQRVADDVFDLHDFIREFFLSRLTPRHREELHARAVEYYAALEGHRATFERLYHLVRAHLDRQAAEVVISQGWELISKGYLDEFLDLIRLVQLGALERPAQAALLELQGRILDLQGNSEEALEAFQSAFELQEDEADQLRSLWNIGWIRQKRNRWDLARQDFERCLTISKRLHDPAGEAEARYGLGRVAWRMGDLGTAEEQCKAALEVAEQADDKDIIASTYIELGRIFSQRGDLEAAEQCFQSSLQTLKQVDNPFEQVRAYNALGWEVLRERGDLDGAAEAFTKGMLILGDLGFMELVGPLHHSLGEVRIAQGRIEEGRELLAQSAKVFGRIGDDHGLAYVHLALAMADSAEAKVSSLGTELATALHLFSTVGTPYDLGYALWTGSRLLRATPEATAPFLKATLMGSNDVTRVCELPPQGSPDAVADALQHAARRWFEKVGAAAYLARIDAAGRGRAPPRTMPDLGAGRERDPRT